MNLLAGTGVAAREYQTSAGWTMYTTEQVQWLRMIKDYIAASFHVDKDDFNLDHSTKEAVSEKCDSYSAKKPIGLSMN